MTTKGKEGSLTIEAALVLPLFLFAMLLIIQLSDALCLHMTIEGAMHQNVKRAAKKAYVQAVDLQALYNKVTEDIGTEYLERAPIENGSRGLHFQETTGGQTDVIDICATYHLKIPFDLFGVGSIPMSIRCVAHKWVGYGGGFQTRRTISEEEYVYITPHGTVYHKSADCSHIRLSIREVAGNEIRNLRNTDGSKYKRCEYCHCSLNEDHIYITDSGDRYHNSLTCSGLKRDIIAIPISEVGTRSPCSRCGGSH